MAKTSDSISEDKNCKISGIRELQAIDVRKSYRNIGSAMVGDGADGTIIVVVLIVVMVMEGDNKHRVHHGHHHREGNEIPKTLS